jgi:cyclophilin family peptidyl-prolyl cis-trans isomerase
MKKWFRMIWVIGLAALPVWSASADTLAFFRTPLGILDVQLFDQDKPVTVRNFMRYVNEGVYSNMFFHRYVPQFVMQGGGFFVTNRTGSSPELVPVQTFGQITNEYNVGRKISNTLGTLAMAKLGGDPNSASSQWFFNLANNASNLDNQNGGFTVFAKVLGSTAVFNRFTNLFRANLGGAFTDLPLLKSNATVEDLVYVDIALLRIQIKANTNGTRQLSWNTASNRVNRLEYATRIPPNWQSLVNVTGNGGVQIVTDTNRTAALRFYRVRVDY